MVEVVSAVTVGLGIAPLPASLLRDKLMTGVLTPLLCRSLVKEFALHLLYPSHRHVTPKVRAFIDLIFESGDTAVVSRAPASAPTSATATQSMQ
jgi:DNA-binding transcriptional LysR family regulator